MNLRKLRLQSIIEYAQQSALLRLCPQSDVSKHGEFAEFEHNMRDLPGVHFDINTEDEASEIWLSVDRMQKSPEPKPESELLKIWIEIGNDLVKEPTLVTHVAAEKLIEIGALDLTDNSEAIDPQNLISLNTFHLKDNVEDQFKAYMANIWKPWASEEKRRRRTVSLYAKLFTLKQQLEGGIVDAQLEFVWGIGMAVWNMNGERVSYPVITQLVELSLNQTTMALEVRPRDMEPRIEVGIYAVADNPSVAKLEKIGKEFFTSTTTTLSPFDPGSFEPLLRSAVSNLDPKGIYWPIQTSPDDRSLPNASDELKVTDTWVLFARPKSANIFIQDLEKFKVLLDENKEGITLPRTITSLISEPATVSEEIKLPSFRGISMVDGGYGNTTEYTQPPQDLFFPMPYNEEQVRIVQLLERHDGVVVQGPPGTGKTYTIANILCHYLAMGKKVLVTSMKDPALAVLKGKLPCEIQPLVISVLTSEQEGLKQFEHAISKIASEVQRINKSAYAKEISQLESTIDALHAKLAKIDSQINEWATMHLTRFKLDGESLEPREAAEEVVANHQEIIWLDDPITITAEYTPQFDDTDIIQLRDARRKLGQDLDYLKCKLPVITSFPSTQELLQVHQDISRSTELKALVECGSVPPIIDFNKSTLLRAQDLATKLSNLRLLRQKVRNAQKDWIKSMLDLLRGGSKFDILELFEVLGVDLEGAVSDKRNFLARPVFLPDDFEQNEIILDAIRNLAQKKSPFGIGGFLGKSAEKKLLVSVKVLNSAPQKQSDWQHVLDYAVHLQKIRTLLTRWSPLARELNLPDFSYNPSELQAVFEVYETYKSLKSYVHLEREVIETCKAILPDWNEVESILYEDTCIHEAERITLHHLTHSRLAETSNFKERLGTVLSGCSGRVVSSINDFIDTVLGNPSFSISEVQMKWGKLFEELKRIHSLSTDIDIVNKVTHVINNSGAVKWAERLRSEIMVSTVDELLPSNWKQGWRLKRLHTYLNLIDGRNELRNLAVVRSETVINLEKTYEEIVRKRTWLKLAENATPSVRSALQGYMSAIAKIGKGTGKRAVRYRKDARNAAYMANPAIPCWIMRHDRISESLPPQFGCFDLVIIDEASQSDLNALPAILRAEKILIVGDDKQVSPEGVGIEEEKIRNLMSRFLSDQVEIYRPQMSPDRSIYDLFKVVFASSSVMLREHFRCVAPIIEYSKREFYNHELKALRLPKISERLDPPLIDVYIEDGFRKGDINLAEARFIINEIRRITNDEMLSKRSIGVVSLHSDKQALKIWKMLEDELGHDIINRHSIRCGDARTFQGDARDIIFLSMVVSHNNAMASSRDTFKQRFNVAAFRARDRMYLVRSISNDELSNADTLRSGLIAHFSNPFFQDAKRVEDLRELCESPFEREIYDILTERGYRITPQVPAGEFRIDMVVEGNNDARLAIECDGDRYHGQDQWEHDMRRQRILERAGWRFWRCFASNFVMKRSEVVAELLQTLHVNGIEPLGAMETTLSPHVQHRRISIFSDEEHQDEDKAQEEQNIATIV